MKQIFTLLSLTLVLANTSFAQYSNNFDGSITSGCTVLSSVNQTTTAGEVITGTGSLYSNPPVNGSSTRDFSTPYLDVISTSLSVSFNYKLSSTLNGQAERTIQVGLLDINNNFTLLSTITMDKDNDPIVATPFNQTFTVATGTQRLSIRMGGAQGNGSVRVIIDDLNVSASTHYAGGCNSAPIAVANNFFSATSLPYSDNVTGNDSDPNAGETLSASMVAQPLATQGIVSLNANGDFTFTPAVGFLGGTVTFTYGVTDNGYDPMSSTTTVTIDYPSFIPLPVQLISFNGSLINNKVQLKWFVAENETGNYFEVERSSDGKNFSTVAVVSTTQKQGNETYMYNEAAQASNYYRLRIVNKDKSTSYSKVLLIKGQTTTANTVILYQNPIQETLTFSFTSATNANNEIAVYNLVGAKVYAEKIIAQKGTNSVSIKLNSYMTAGTYILEVKNSTERNVAKFIKQ